MLDARINTSKVWYSTPTGEEVEIVDENGDYTGENAYSYGNPTPLRANLSPAHGSADENVFGLSLDYTKVLTTAKKGLGITEQSLIWDEEPNPQTIVYVTKNEDGEIISTSVDVPGNEDSVYKVVRVAVGKYHTRYALKRLHGDD